MYMLTLSPSTLSSLLSVSFENKTKEEKMVSLKPQKNDILLQNREGKLLRHVAMVAKFVDDNKPKIHLRSKFALHRCYSVSFNLSYVGEIFWIESERTVFEFRKLRPRNFLCCVDLLMKLGKFHVAVVQRWLKNVQKSVMHEQSCFFANINLLLFCHSRCLYRRCCLSTLLL